MLLRVISETGEVHLWAAEVERYLNDPDTLVGALDVSDKAELLAVIHDEMATDDLAEDTFILAALDDDELDDETAIELMDLCDIVAAVEKGHIIYG